MRDGCCRSWTGISFKTLVHVSVLSALVGGKGLTAVHHSRQQVLQSLRWAERQLSRASRPPFKFGQTLDCIPHRELLNAKSAFARIISREGASARASLGLGECHMRLAEYSDAVLSFEQALKLAPSNHVAKKGLLRARLLHGISQSINPQLPQSNRIIQMMELPSSRDRNLWLILSAGIIDAYYIFYDDVHLSLYRRTGPVLAKVWESQKLVDPRFCGRFGIVQLCPMKTPSRSASYIAVSKVFIGGSWAPSHVDVFAWEHEHMTKVLGVRGSDPIWIDDLNHDGRYEIVNTYEIGKLMCHAEQPFWNNIYAFRQGGYVLANRYFPKLFRGRTRELRSMLRKYPADEEIRLYLEYVKQLVRKRQDSRVLSEYERRLGILRR